MTAGTQADAVPTKWEDQSKVLTVNFVPIKIEPDYCELSYVCTSVVRDDGESTNFVCPDLSTIPSTCTEEDTTDCVISTTVDPDDYLNGDVEPGIYTVNINGCVILAEIETCTTTNVKIELVDPCDPPDTVTVPVYVDQTYILTKEG